AVAGGDRVGQAGLVVAADEAVEEQGGHPGGVAILGELQGAAVAQAEGVSGGAGHGWVRASGGVRAGCPAPVSSLSPSYATATELDSRRRAVLEAPRLAGPALRRARLRRSSLRHPTPTSAVPSASGAPRRGADPGSTGRSARGASRGGIGGSRS